MNETYGYEKNSDTAIVCLCWYSYWFIACSIDCHLRPDFCIQYQPKASMDTHYWNHKKRVPNNFCV